MISSFEIYKYHSIGHLYILKRFPWGVPIYEREMP